MDKYAYKATNLIAEAFENQGIRFDVLDRSNHEQVVAGFSVECGPNVAVRFITAADRNDVHVHVFGLVSSTPKSKRPRLLEACNILNNKVRFAKFTLDEDGDVDVEYDFSENTPDDALGEIAVDILKTVVLILNCEYQVLMKALYSEDELTAQDTSPVDLIRRLRELRDMMGDDTSEDDDLEVLTSSDDTLV